MIISGPGLVLEMFVITFLWPVTVKNTTKASDLDANVDILTIIILLKIFL